MTTTAAPAPPPAYAVPEPTEQEALAALAEIVGADEAERSWARACAAAGARPGRLTLEELWRVAQALATEGGMVGVTARSLGIRIRSFVLLRQRLQRV